MLRIFWLIFYIFIIAPSVLGVLVFLSYLLMLVQTAPLPGSSHHHVHHRIHVPQKIKTVYHTKVVKVPEHHHYYHEKEKVVPIHVEKEKLVPVPIEKEKFVPIHIPHKEEPHYPPIHEQYDSYGHEQLYDGGEHNQFYDGGEHNQFYDGGEHNILKKHAPNHSIERKKQRRVRKS